MTVPTSLTKVFISSLTAYFRSWTTTEVIEQAYLGDELLSRIERSSKIRLQGKYFQVPVNFLNDPQGDSMDGADVVSTAGSDTRTIAEYQVCNYTEPCKVLWTDIQDAGDEAGIFSLTEENVKDTRLRQTKLINRDLAASARGNTKDLIPLLLHIPTAPSATTLGNISQSDNSTWANQSQSIGSFSGNFHKLEELSVDCRKGGLTDWDFAIGDKDTYLYFKKLYRQYMSIQVGSGYDGNANADLGVGGKRNDLFFENRPVSYDLSLGGTWTRNRRSGASATVAGAFNSTGGMFFINSKAFKLAVSPKSEFTMTDFESMAPGGQLGVISYSLWRGQSITQERSANGIAHTISA